MKLSEVNLNDLDAFERGCPHDMFEVLRREAPVFWQDEPNGSGYWAITKYEDLKHISRHPMEFSSERQGSLIRDPDPGRARVHPAGDALDGPAQAPPLPHRS